MIKKDEVIEETNIDYINKENIINVDLGYIFTKIQKE